MNKTNKEGMDKIINYIKQQDGYIYLSSHKHANTHLLNLKDLGYMVQVDTTKRSDKFIRLFFYDSKGIYNLYNNGSIEEELLFKLVERVAEYETKQITTKETYSETVQ